MRHPFKIVAVTTALVCASMLGASAAAAGSLGLRSASHGEVRPAPYWRWANSCRGGRYYTYGGGWGCDHYLYGYDAPRRR